MTDDRIVHESAYDASEPAESGFATHRLNSRCSATAPALLHRGVKPLYGGDVPLHRARNRAARNCHVDQLEAAARLTNKSII
jgi:hypothetical protein